MGRIVARASIYVAGCDPPPPPRGRRVGPPYFSCSGAVSFVLELDVASPNWGKPAPFLLFACVLDLRGMKPASLSFAVRQFHSVWIRGCLGLSLGFLVLFASGCGSISAEGIDGFSPMSQTWVVETAGTARSHKLILSSVGGYCGKRRNAEQGRLDADRRLAEREAAGDPLCESNDLWWDDLAEALASTEGNGARYLEIVLARDDAGESTDSITAPGVGHFALFGANRDGSFSGQLRYYKGDYWANRADAHTCSSPEEADAEVLAAFLAEDEPDLREIWNLNGGSVDLSEAGDDRWGVVVDADVADESGATVGSITSDFTASKCDVEVEADVDSPLN